MQLLGLAEKRLKEAWVGLNVPLRKERAQKANAELGSLLAAVVKVKCTKFCAGHL